VSVVEKNRIAYSMVWGNDLSRMLQNISSQFARTTEQGCLKFPTDFGPLIRINTEHFTNRDHINLWRGNCAYSV